MKIWRWLRWVLLIFIIPLGLLFLIIGISQFAPDKPPKDFLIIYNMFDFNQVRGISRFRSCEGHRTMSQGTKEADSSMAHYIMTNAKFKTDSQGKVKIFAPFDGYVTDSLNTQGFSFVPKSSLIPWWPFNQFRINLAHVKSLTKYKGTVPVKAGELVGYDDPNEYYPDAPNISLDVRIGVMALPPEMKANNGEPLKNMDSMFHYMSDEVFTEYKKTFGVNSPEDFIVPISYREQHPCTLRDGGPYFSYTSGSFEDPKYSNYVLRE